jgi:hypothetical protein
VRPRKPPYAHRAAQVAGFVVNPRAAGGKYIDGVLSPLSTPDPDYDAYPA